ncbi:MAG: hypothetical protein ACJ8LG_06780 [Massilia sp.]
MNQQLFVEPIGNLIIARFRGQPTAQMFAECQQRIIELIKDTGQRQVLYDGLEMDAPSVDLVLMQQEMEAQLRPIRLRRAIVVPNTRIAYLARLAFGEGDHRVFYNDLGAALRWLEGDGSPGA